jgi:hypothetical protein
MSEAHSIIPRPWWQQAAAEWIELPSGAQYYNFAIELRKKRFHLRLNEAEKLSELQFVVRYCVWVESVGLEKDTAGRVVRLFKLAKSLEDFADKVPEDVKPRVQTLGFLQELGEDDALYERVRLSLVPKREQILTEDQKEGLARLRTIESERSRILSQYSAKEDKLAEELRKIRAERDTFNTQLKVVLPEWKEVLEARKTRLTLKEREESLTLYEQNLEYKARYTEEAFLLTVQQNKAAKKERSVYESFRRFSDETSCRNQVAAALPQSAEEGIGREGPLGLDPSILPLM